MKLYKLFWKFVEKNDKKRLKTVTYPNDVESIENIKYSNDKSNYHNLDIYYHSKDKKTPTIIDVHGGGWVYGDKAINKEYGMLLSKQGFNVVNINYTLLKKDTYIGQVRDLFTFFNWLELNAEKYSLDLKNLFITGDSAGAHLVAFALNVLNSKELQKEFNLMSNIKFNAAAFTCGAFNPSSYYNKKIVDDLIPNHPVINKIIYNALVVYLKTLYADEEGRIKDLQDTDKTLTNHICPCLFLSSYNDMLKDSTLTTYNIYKNINPNCELYFVESEDNETHHNLEHVYNILNPNWKESIKTNKAMCDFFFKYTMTLY